MTSSDLLKKFRSEAGISIRTMAKKMGMPPSSYQHYEDVYKKDQFPIDIAERLVMALKQLGVPKHRTDQLLPTASKGFEEPAPKIDVLARLNEASSQKQDDSHDRDVNDIRFAMADGLVQVAATVDAKGLDELIKKLKIARQMLE